MSGNSNIDVGTNVEYTNDNHYRLINVYKAAAKLLCEYYNLV